MHRHTLNGRSPHTMRDAARDAYDWFEREPQDWLAHPRAPNGNTWAGFALAVFIGISLALVLAYC